MTPNKKTFIYIAIIVAVLALVFVAVSIFKGQFVLNQKENLPDFSKFENQPLPPPVALSGRQVYQILGNSKFTPSIAGVIIDPVNVAGGETQNIYVLMVSDVMPTPLPTLPTRKNIKNLIIPAKNIGGYVSVADGKNPEVKVNLVSSTLPVASFEQPYSVNTSGTVIFSSLQNSSDKVISVFKAEIKLPKTFGAANRFFISVSDSTGRMHSVAINRQSSCEYPNGGDWTPDTECNFSYVGGVDNGNLNLSNQVSLTLDDTFAINSDKTINISGMGSLAVNLTSGGLKSGFIWRSFDDKNGATQKIGKSLPGSGYYRRSLFPNPPKFQPKGKFNLSQSKETFTVTEDSSVWPKIYQAVIDPPDVHVGDTQNLGLVVQAEAGQNITSVVAEIETDKDTVKLPLTLEGQTAEADIAPNPYYIDGQNHLAFGKADEMKAIASIGPVAKTISSPKFTYTGSWVVKDTHDTKYHTTFIVTDSSGRVNKMTMAWSDVCSIPRGGDWVMSSYGSCAISSDDGVDNGNITVNGGWTLTIYSNVTFAFNPGKSITVQAGNGSKIVMNSVTSQIVKKYICYTDYDVDSYASYNSVPTYGSASTCPSGNVRRFNSSGVPGYGTPDCYDFNANAYPGEPNYSVWDRGDGSYDWDCNDLEDKQYTTVGGPAGCLGGGICVVGAGGVSGWCSPMSSYCNSPPPTIPACGGWNTAADMPGGSPQCGKDPINNCIVVTFDLQQSCR